MGVSIQNATLAVRWTQINTGYNGDRSGPSNRAAADLRRALYQPWYSNGHLEYSRKLDIQAVNQEPSAVLQREIVIGQTARTVGASKNG